METDFTAVFRAFHQSNSTVADLVIALLTEKRFKRSTKLAELLQRSGNILKVLLSHTRLPASAKKAASNAMQPLYAKEICYLVKPTTGWHFSAHTAMPEDIDDFDLAALASDTVEHAPLLSALFDALLSAKKKGSWTSHTHHTEGDVTMGVDDFENNAVDSNSDEDSNGQGVLEGMFPTTPDQQKTNPIERRKSLLRIVRSSTVCWSSYFMLTVYLLEKDGDI